MKKVLVILVTLLLLLIGCSKTNIDYESRFSGLESANSELIKQVDAHEDQIKSLTDDISEKDSYFKIAEDFDFFTSVPFDTSDSKPLNFNITLLGANSGKYFFEFVIVNMEGSAKLYFPRIISTDKDGDNEVVNLELGDKKTYNGDTGEADSITNLKDDLKDSHEIVIRVYNLETGQVTICSSTKVID